MASDAQIRANRANALHSTGPKTEEGKARISRNALVHGANFTTLMPGEDQAAFIELHTTYQEEFQPQTETDLFLVTRLTLAAWRLHRLAALETLVVSAHQPTYSSPNPAEDPVARAYIRDSQNGNTLHKLARDQTILERSYFSALRALERRRPRPEIGFEN